MYLAPRVYLEVKIALQYTITSRKIKQEHVPWKVGSLYLKSIQKNMYLFKKLPLALLFASILFVGCDSTDSDDEDDDTPPVALEATLSSIQTNIFTPTCGTGPCHDSDSPARSLDLSSGASFASLVNVASMDNPDLLLVNPTNPDSSYLIWKLEGNPGISGEQMPRSGAALSTTQIDVIRMWITDGALDN